SSYARALIKVRADVELNENIMVAMPKLVGDEFYTCNVRVEYEWKPPRCVSCKVFGHGQNECPKNIASGMAKNLKKPSQAPRGVSVGMNVLRRGNSFKRGLLPHCGDDGLLSVEPEKILDRRNGKLNNRAAVHVLVK
nr:hypothetical protein [Tanacetum cinerariifolium]